MCVAAAACGLSELLGRASVRRGGGARLGSTPRRPPRRETPSKRSDSNSTDRPGGERRRAVNATAPSTPARVRVARARVFLSRPVCSPRLLGRGSPCLRTLSLTILSHRSRSVYSLLKPNRPVVRGCQSLERRKTAAKRVLWACRPMPRTSLLDLQALPGQPSSPTQPTTSAADARAGNKAQWAKRRRAHARKSCPWPRNKQRPWPPINWTSPRTRRSCPRVLKHRPRRRY